LLAGRPGLRGAARRGAGRPGARGTRARYLARGLRCLVCRNESIDESNAELARDLRLLVRERLVEGDSDDEVVAFVVDRYGEYVLLNPRHGLEYRALAPAGR
jgi:cytochrome c-type biogenesis protein CcmH